jgi:two-component system OmpR family sensor kinase
MSASFRSLGYSLRARLLLFLLASIFVAALVQAAVAYRSTLEQTDAIFDAQLQRTAVSLNSGDTRLSATPSGAPGGATADDFIIQIWTADGVRLFKSPSGKLLPDPVVLGFSTVQADRTTYRVYATATPFQVTQVAQDMGVRKETARALALRTVGPTVAAAPLLMLVVWWVVSLSLRPVQRTRAELAARQPDDLSPVMETGLPDEIRPLVHELNLLLERTARAFAMQKQFVGDAAHELRSPLAALRLQLRALQRPASEAERLVAVQRVSAGIDRATRLIEQLLSMARHEGGASFGHGAEDPMRTLVDLRAVVRQALSDVLPTATARSIDIGMTDADAAPHAEGQAPQGAGDGTANGTPVWVAGDADALASLVGNLLDNAVKYTPEGGRIDISLRGDAQADVVLRVEDSGPGIAPRERERVFDRFYRSGAQDVVGSGLGLAIVRAVAQRHGATVTLDDAPGLGGLRVDVRFPAPRGNFSTRQDP